MVVLAGGVVLLSVRIKTIFLMKQIKRKQPGYLLFLGSHKKDREQLRVVHGVACTSNQGVYGTTRVSHNLISLVQAKGGEGDWGSSFILQGTWNQRGDSDGKAELKTDK
jgi:hypothetical protein